MDSLYKKPRNEMDLANNLENLRHELWGLSKQVIELEKAVAAAESILSGSRYFTSDDNDGVTSLQAVKDSNDAVWNIDFPVSLNEEQTQMLYTTLKKITFQKLAASIDESLFSQMSFLSNGLKADFDNVKNYCIKHC